MEAEKAGSKPPKPTAAAKALEADQARQREQATRQLARQAVTRLEQAIREHRLEWLPPQEQAARDLGGEAIAAIDQLERDVLARMGRALGIVGALHVDRSDSDHGRIFKSPTVGAAQGQPVTKLLAELRQTIAEAMPPEPPTAEELARREQVQETRQAWSAMARGGVAV
jgi:hypothetical protein